LKFASEREECCDEFVGFSKPINNDDKLSLAIFYAR